MELQGLKIFRDLAHEKSFVKTAKLNFVTQPAVSYHLKHLEEELGVKLFERSPHKVSLSKEGEALLPQVEDILEKCMGLKTRIADLKSLPKGDIRIATIYSIGIYELAPVLKKFIRRYPEIHVHLQYRRSDIIYDLVLKNKIDLGMVAYPENRSKINVRIFDSDHLVLIVPPHHRLAKQRSVRLREIKGESFIAFDRGIPTREAIDKMLEQRDAKVKIRMTNENVDTLKRSVEVGLGISIVPSKTVREEIRKGTLKSLEIKDVRLDRPLGILTLKEQAPSLAVELFMQMFPGDTSGS